jgi:hypothetical protein
MGGDDGKLLKAEPMYYHPPSSAQNCGWYEEIFV